MLRWFDLPAMQIFHTINAWQEGNRIKFFTCYLPGVRPAPGCWAAALGDLPEMLADNGAPQQLRATLQHLAEVISRACLMHASARAAMAARGALGRPVARWCVCAVRGHVMHLGWQSYLPGVHGRLTIHTRLRAALLLRQLSQRCLQLKADGSQSEPLSVAATDFSVAEFTLDMDTGMTSRRLLAESAAGEYPKIPTHLQSAPPSVHLRGARLPEGIGPRTVQLPASAPAAQEGSAGVGGFGLLAVCGMPSAARLQDPGSHVLDGPVHRQTHQVCLHGALGRGPQQEQAPWFDGLLILSPN